MPTFIPYEVENLIEYELSEPDDGLEESVAQWWEVESRICADLFDEIRVMKGGPVSHTTPVFSEGGMNIGELVELDIDESFNNAAQSAAEYSDCDDAPTIGFRIVCNARRA